MTRRSDIPNGKYCVGCERRIIIHRRMSRYAFNAIEVIRTSQPLQHKLRDDVLGPKWVLPSGPYRAGRHKRIANPVTGGGPSRRRRRQAQEAQLLPCAPTNNGSLDRTKGRSTQFLPADVERAGSIQEWETVNAEPLRSHQSAEFERNVEHLRRGESTMMRNPHAKEWTVRVCGRSVQITGDIGQRHFERVIGISRMASEVAPDGIVDRVRQERRLGEFSRCQTRFDGLQEVAQVSPQGGRKVSAERQWQAKSYGERCRHGR